MYGRNDEVTSKHKRFSKTPTMFDDNLSGFRGPVNTFGWMVSLFSVLDLVQSSPIHELFCWRNDECIPLRHSESELVSIKSYCVRVVIRVFRCHDHQ